MPSRGLPFLNKSSIVQCACGISQLLTERRAGQTSAAAHKSWTFPIKVTLVSGGRLCAGGVGEFVKTLCGFRKSFCGSTCILWPVTELRVRNNLFEPKHSMLYKNNNRDKTNKRKPKSAVLSNTLQVLNQFTYLSNLIL